MLTQMPMDRNGLCTEKVVQDDRYNRSFKTDMQEAVRLMVEFQEALGKLHPQCMYLIENLLQRQRY